MDVHLLATPGNVWFIGLVAISVTGLCFVLNKSLGKSPLTAWRFNSRKASSAGTPPRSVSPEKKQKSVTNPTSSSPYADVLPPQRRQALSNIENDAVPCGAADEEVVKAHLLPITTDYRNSPDERYTPTGFSAKEVKLLGDFPDYAELSGVPLPRAYHEFNIDKAIPRPYRPFRWAYHQTMSITKLETDWWIELENTYKTRIAQRKELHAKHGRKVLDYLPGSELACKELMEMVLQYICSRYPQYFSLVEKKKGECVFRNGILGTEQDVGSKHPLEILMDNVPEDFAITLRDDVSGYYVFRAGVICSSLGWDVSTKIGLQLHEIHAPIPDYKEKMQFSMDRFFSKFPTDKPIQRGSWGLEVGKPLFMPGGDPHEAHRLSQNPNLQLSDCHLRVDWQTLRRLPLSAGVVFNFKALFTPVTEFRDEPGVPALVAKVLRDGKRNLMEYKGTWHVEHVVLPKLEEWAKEQVERGLVPGDWEVATLEESPWFRNWEEKWHRQQGY